MVAASRTPVKKAKTYRVETAIYHDGESYASGKTIALGGDEAAPLLVVGAISERKPPKETGPE